MKLVWPFLFCLWGCVRGAVDYWTHPWNKANKEGGWDRFSHSDWIWCSLAEMDGNMRVKNMNTEIKIEHRTISSLKGDWIFIGSFSLAALNECVNMVDESSWCHIYWIMRLILEHHRAYIEVITHNSVNYISVFLWYRVYDDGTKISVSDNDLMDLVILLFYVSVSCI